MHSGSYGFPDGIPGICEKCFRTDPDAKRYYCSHNGRGAVYKDGCWETLSGRRIPDSLQLRRRLLLSASGKSLTLSIQRKV